MCKMLCKILNELLEEIPFVMLVNVIGTVPVQFYLHSDDMEVFVVEVERCSL